MPAASAAQSADELPVPHVLTHRCPSLPGSLDTAARGTCMLPLAEWAHGSHDCTPSEPPCLALADPQRLGGSPFCDLGSVGPLLPPFGPRVRMATIHSQSLGALSAPAGRL